MIGKQEKAKKLYVRRKWGKTKERKKWKVKILDRKEKQKTKPWGRKNCNPPKKRKIH